MLLRGVASYQNPEPSLSSGAEEMSERKCPTSNPWDGRSLHFAAARVFTGIKEMPQISTLVTGFLREAEQHRSAKKPDMGLTEARSPEADYGHYM